MPDLPTVSEAFEADIGPFIAAIHDARDAMLEAAAAAKTLQDTIDSLHGKTLDINLETTGASAAAAATAVGNLAGAENRATAAAAAFGDGQRSAAGGAVAAGAAAGAAAAGFRLWGTGIRLTGTALHWIVAGAAEFLAVAIPAAIALGAGLAVAAQGAQNAYQHFSALYAATESTRSAFGQTVGSVLGLGSALQKAQDAANPGVYEILGSVINDIKGYAANAGTGLGQLATTGLQVVHAFDEFAARVTVDLQTGMGTKIQGMIGGMVTALSEFGQIIANVGHAILNFAAAMPGLAKVLLAIADGVSKVILAISSIPAPIITAVMALEEFYRWGGLALALLIRLAAAPMAFAAWLTGVNFITKFGAALSTIVAGAGRALVAMGGLIAGIGAEEGVFTALGASVANAGGGMLRFATMSNLAVAGIAGGVAAVAGLTLYFANLKDATEKWIATSQQAVQQASDMNVLNVIGQQLTASMIRLGPAMAATAAGVKEAGTQSGYATVRFGDMNGVVGKAANNSIALQQHLVSLIGTANTVRTNIGLLAGAFGISATGALALANAAGVNLQAGMTKGSMAMKIAVQQINNLRTGLGAMSAPIGVVGADMQAVGIQSQLAASKVQTVNQSLDAFVGATTGGMSTLMQFNAALRAMGKDTVSTSQSITGQISSISSTAQKMGFTLQGIGPKAQQSWQQFDGALQQANSVLDTMRTGMAENVVSAGQYQTSIRDAGGALLPFAAHNRTALSMVSQLAQELGVPATHNLKTLAQEFGITGRAAQNQLAGGVERAIARMSNLNVVARNLSVTVGQQLDTAMASAITKFSGVQGAAAKYAQALANVNTPQSVLIKAKVAFNTALQREASMTATATGDMNKHATALGKVATGYKNAGTSAHDYAKTSSDVSTALQDTVSRADNAARSTQQFGSQAHTAAGSAMGLSSNAQQATTQVKNLGTAAQTTQGHLGNVNNEIRTTATAASNSASPLGTMISNIGRVGAAAFTAAGQVHALAVAMSGLQSKTITLTTNMVTVTSTIHRQHGGPVWPGIPAVVGEAGPELFIPSQPGYIVPHAETERFLSSPGGPAGGIGGGGGFSGTVNLTATLHNTAMMDGQQVWSGIRTETLRWNVRNGNPQSGAMGRATAPGA